MVVVHRYKYLCASAKMAVKDAERDLIECRKRNKPLVKKARGW